MNKFKFALVSLLTVTGMSMAVPVIASAATTPSPVATQITGGVDAVGGSSDKSTLGGNIKIVVDILLYILGAIAVLMIVIGGVRYTTSNGESSSIKGAKDTILYAVVGLVIAVMAYAIVNFVVKSF